MQRSLKRVRDWLIANERSLRVLAVVVLAVIFIVQWVRAGLLLRDGDFYLHWQFGGRFLRRELLYADGLHIPYPPFWAMFWSPIGALPLAVAKLVCYPISAVALGWLLWLMNRLTRRRLPLAGPALFWTTVAVLAVLSRFIVRELPECGPNLLLLALSWTAIWLWRERCDSAAGGCLGLAVAMKCTPALLVAYFAWKRQWRLTFAATATAVALTLAPVLWQGPADYARHVEIWFTNLRLGTAQRDPSTGVLGPETLQNLSLRPAVARWLMCLPAGHPSRLDHPLYVDFLSLSPAAADGCVKLSLFGLLSAVAWMVRGPARRREDDALLWQCAAVGVLALLLSPITWYQHCVALVPPFYLVARTWAVRGRPAAWMLSMLTAFAIVHLVLSRGLIGRDATLLLASFHLTTWTLCGVLAITLGGRARAAAVERAEEAIGEPRAAVRTIREAA